jgi:cobalt-zinc-cadmium efflux system outer membrane protein
MNVPIYHRKLAAGVCEARFRVAQRQAEYDQKVADIQYEVEAARAQVEESHRIVNLYATKLLPTAERSVSVARTNYDVNKSSFLSLAQSQRQFIELREKHQEALADLHRRLAELERVTGGTIPVFAESEGEKLPPLDR